MLEASSASGSFGFSLMGYNCTIVYGENKWQIPGMYNFYKVYITYKLLQPTLKVFVSTHLAVLVGKNDHSICIVGLHPVQIIAFHERTLHIKYWRIKWVEKCRKKREIETWKYLTLGYFFLRNPSNSRAGSSGWRNTASTSTSFIILVIEKFNLFWS